YTAISSKWNNSEQLIEFIRRNKSWFLKNLCDYRVLDLLIYVKEKISLSDNYSWPPGMLVIFGAKFHKLNEESFIWINSSLCLISAYGAPVYEKLVNFCIAEKLMNLIDLVKEEEDYCGGYPYFIEWFSHLDILGHSVEFVIKAFEITMFGYHSHIIAIENLLMRGFKEKLLLSGMDVVAKKIPFESLD